MAAGELLQLAEPGLELGVRDLEALQIILDLVEFHLLRGGVGVDLALDPIQLGVKRGFGLLARIGQSSLELRANPRRERSARCSDRGGEARGSGAGLRDGLARLLDLTGQVAEFVRRPVSAPRRRRRR